MTEKLISPRQLSALQSLFAVYARHEMIAGDIRTSRLAWASELLKREVTSFSCLSHYEAAGLISRLKQTLGQSDKRPSRKELDRQAARARGTHGRRGKVVNIEMIAAPEDIAQIHEMRARLGMSAANFQNWLASPSSPMRGRQELRTISDCNRVRWALKAMLKRAG